MVFAQSRKATGSQSHRLTEPAPLALLTAPRSRLDAQRDKPWIQGLAREGGGWFWRGNQTKSQLCDRFENFNEKLISPHLPVQPSPGRGRDGGSGHGP